MGLSQILRTRASKHRADFPSFMLSIATRALKAQSCLLRLAFISIVGYRFIDLLQPSLFYLLASGPIFGVHLSSCRSSKHSHRIEQWGFSFCHRQGWFRVAQRCDSKKHVINRIAKQKRQKKALQMKI